MDNDEALKAAFVAALGIDPSSDFESLTYRGIDEWDSVAHMQLVAEIEDAFGIMLDTEDVVGMNSFPVAREIVGKYETQA